MFELMARDQVEIDGLTASSQANLAQIQIDDARIHLRNGCWNIPICPSRWPDPLFPYYEALAEIEDQVQENDGLKVSIASEETIGDDWQQ